MLEIHLFDFRDDLYGQQVEVEFVQFIRADEKFESTEALSHRIAQDMVEARALLS